MREPKTYAEFRAFCQADHRMLYAKRIKKFLFEDVEATAAYLHHETMRVMKRLVHWKLRGQGGRSRRWHEGWTEECLERQTTRPLATPTRRTSAMTRGRFSFVHSSLSLIDTGYNIFDRLTVRYLEGSARPLRFRSLEAAQSYAAWLLAYEAGSATEPPASFLACYRERERCGGTTMSTAHRFPTGEAAQKWLDRHIEITEQHGMRIDLAVIHPLRACDEV